MYKYGNIEGSKRQIMEELHAIANESRNVFMNNDEQNNNNCNNTGKINKL